MPFESEAQRRWMYATKPQMAAEWQAHTPPGTKLPKKKKIMKKADANDIVDMNSTGGALADYLAPVSWGGERAGRTQAMAEAMNEDTTFNVRHPATSNGLSSLAGAGIGGLVGAAGGFGAGKLMGSPPQDMGTAIGAGTSGGAVLGGITGNLLSGRSRRKEMQRVNDAYNEDEPQGKVYPSRPDLSLLSAAFMPGRGSHRTGQVEATRHMLGEDTIKNQHSKVRDLLYAAGLVVPYAGPVHGLAQNIKTQYETAKDKKREKKKTPAVRRQKQASFQAVDLETVPVEAAIERLAMRKVAVDNGFEQPIASEILNSSDFLSSIATRVKQAESAMAPLARNALIGAGVGTVAGLGASAFSKRKQKNWVNNALLGGLAGGAIGGGYHMITNPDAMGAALAAKVAPPPVDPHPVGPKLPVAPPISDEAFKELNERATSKRPEIAGGIALAGGGAIAASYGFKKHLDLDKATGQLQGVLTDPKKREMVEEFLQRNHGAPLPRTRDTKGLVDDLVTKYDPAKKDDPVNLLLSKREFRKINPVSGGGIQENKLRHRAGKLVSDPATSGRFTGSNYTKYDRLDDAFIENDIGKVLSKAHAVDPARLRASLAPVIGAAEKDLPQISRVGRAIRRLSLLNPKKLALMAASLGLTTAGAYGMSHYNRSSAQQEQSKVLQELQKQRASE